VPESGFTERPAMSIDNPFLWLFDKVINLYIWVLIASAVLSWLVAFNVVNPYNNVVRTISGILYQLTEPLLRPIRNLLPNLGGLDISPVILILILMFVHRFVFCSSLELAARPLARGDRRRSSRHPCHAQGRA